MQRQQHTKKVILAGAGPGDPDLITVKTAGWLQRAEVVITDRLVSTEILKRYVNKSAEIIFVGKQGGRPASTPQQEINQLLVQYANTGKLVVRLKGGDVSLFSNILDELKTLTENNISYEIVPGISAASGASAYAGIPLTARGHATAVRFLTCYKDDVIAESAWEELAACTDTLVFYMSSGNLDNIIKKLIAQRVGKEKHVAVIEQATTPGQRIHTASVYDYEQKFAGKQYVSPSLVIIGSVVSLLSDFAWWSGSTEMKEYFDPVQGKWIYKKKEAARA